MKKQMFILLILVLILSACTPVTTAGSQLNTPNPSSTTTRSPEIFTPTAPTTKTPILTTALSSTATKALEISTSTPLPTKPTGTPASPDQEPTQSTLALTPTNEEMPIAVFHPSLQIGKGTAISLAVSPDGKWMAVSTPFGVYQYHASSFQEAWFFPFEENDSWPTAYSIPDRVLFNPQSTRMRVSTTKGDVILDAVTGKQINKPENIGEGFRWSPDDLRLVSGGHCETVTIMDVNTGAVLKELYRGTCRTESSDGIFTTWGADGRIYAAKQYSDSIFVWDGDTYNPIGSGPIKGISATANTVVPAPTGNLIAQYDGLGGNVVAIIDIEQQLPTVILDQRVNGPLIALAWSPDGKRLATHYGMHTGVTLIWNVQTGAVDQRLEGFYTATGLGWSADGQILYGLQTMDRKIHAVEANSGRILNSLEDHIWEQFFLTWTDEGIAARDWFTLTWWNPFNGKIKQRETVDSTQIALISWPPNGPEVVLHSDGSIYNRQGATVKLANYSARLPTDWSWDGNYIADPTHVWDTQTGQLVMSLNQPAEQQPPEKVAWSPDSNRIASSGSSATQPPFIWDAHTGNILLTLKAEFGNINPKWVGLAWSPNNQQLAALGGAGVILIWDTQTGQQKLLLRDGRMKCEQMWTNSWSPDGRLFICGTGKDLFVWDVVNQEPLARLEGHRDIIRYVAWSPDGKRLASTGTDGTIQIWEIAK